MEIDVFDFDGTIYDGDSTVDFLKYVFSRKPFLLFCILPHLFVTALKAVSGRFSLTGFKSGLFSCLARHISLEEEANRFWELEKTKSKLGSWFWKRERRRPVVIASASPDFELKAAARILLPDLLVCTRCDPATGRLIGENCKSSEKIRRIREEWGEYIVHAMYTDDVRADGPLLALAEEKYLVCHGKVSRINSI
ncbi:MAG: haloacid dehalogenase-like hydrolase [Clostridia bacterium]|nr:haloacid dehalogenase-like hydrolase [Clostridia bacterium]